MKSITLKFSSLQQMLEFIKASRICNYEQSRAVNLLTAELSDEQLALAKKYNATIADRSFSAPGSR